MGKSDREVNHLTNRLLPSQDELNKELTELPVQEQFLMTMATLQAIANMGPTARVMAGAAMSMVVVLGRAIPDINLPSDDDELATLIADYIIEELIGNSSFGHLFR